MTKYQKPIERNLSDMKVAAGQCSSGTLPLEQCSPIGGVNFAYCRQGTAPGTRPSCTGGSSATTCSPHGSTAGFEPSEP
jgi:hypothetical protein